MTLRAWIDDRGRPIVAVYYSATRDPLICLIDTGFHGALMIDFNTACSLGVKTGGPEVDDIVVGGKQLVTVTKLLIDWPGLTGPTSVRVLPAGSVLFPAQMTWPGADPEPDALLGRELLDGTVLAINYCRRTVAIESCLAD